jgi:hypothetical protein
MMRERFLTTLTRSTGLAVVLGVVLYFVLPRQGGGWWGLLDAFTLAFCFAFLGHYLELILLMIPDIEVGIGRVVRLAGWFGGGMWIYEIGRRIWLLYGRSTLDLPSLVWGGAFFVVLELVIHALLRAQGKPNYYGTGAR